MRDASLFGEAEAVRRILLSAQAGVHRRLTVDGLSKMKGIFGSRDDRKGKPITSPTHTDRHR